MAELVSVPSSPSTSVSIVPEMQPVQPSVVPMGGRKCMLVVQQVAMLVGLILGAALTGAVGMSAAVRLGIRFAAK